MTTVGQQLLTPEAGWKRHTDIITYNGVTANANFSYIGTWTDNPPDAKRTNTMGSQVKFNFTGTKIRIITQIWPGLSSSILIKIDDLDEENFSTATGEIGHFGLAYEKLNLEDMEHSVVITANVNQVFDFEGIDIDNNSQLLEYRIVSQDNILVLSSFNYKKYSASSWQTVTSSTPTESDYLQGNTIEEIASIPESAWQQLTGIVELCYYTDDTSVAEVQFNIETEPFTLADEFEGKEIKILEYTDNPSQTESTVETEVEPYSIYDEFGDTMEVLYYTDDTDKTKAELEITANYSPLDELEGDYEVVTWSNDEEEGKKLSVNATPLPQFIKSTSPIELHSDLQKIILEEFITSKAKYLFSSDKAQWKTWNGTTFINVNTSTNEDIYKNGLTVDQIHSLTAYDLSKWDSNLIYIGIYLEDDIRDKVKNEIDKISVEGLLPLETSTVSDTKLYILNTTSTINVQLLGPKLVGTVNDEDSTRVQYKVKLNDVDYYPSDGSFTDLQRSPLSISLEIPSSDVLIDQENKLKIEFQDYWGMTDYWETTFIGTYNGILFLDKDGHYYSTNVGEVLQNLDFGVLIAGQTSIEQEIILKNTHGYTVNNIRISSNDDSSNELEVQLSLNDNPFIPLKELVISEELSDQEQITFFVRLSTQKGMNPISTGFDITVTADPVR